MDRLLTKLYAEIDTEKQLLNYHTDQLVRAPKGRLEVELTFDGPVYYWYFPGDSGAGRRIHRINISDDADLIAQLIRKGLSWKIVDIITDNLPLMEGVVIEYLDRHGPLS